MEGLSRGFASTEPNSPRRKRPGPKKGDRHPGQFKPGQSGNPGGRPRTTEAQRTFNARCKEASLEALEFLINLVDDSKAPAKERRAAAETLIAHAEGLPVSRNLVADLSTAAPAGELSNDELKARLQQLVTQGVTYEHGE